jgi:DNA (cytosine-5)-methyltransferase 1
MRILSVFSGVGGMDLGLERAGHQIVGMCEIDNKARSVLTHRWPNIPIWDDIQTLDGKEWRGRVDVVAGGSPCQDLSVAGKRGGLDGERSGLFWHQCRVADEAGAEWVVWENVAGALSSNKGADFSAVLWGLTGAFVELPDGKRWGKSGFIVGPKRAAVWRMFDAQWFGVAQRRRRVYLVAGPRELCRPEILFESESLCWDSPPSRETGQEVAGTLGGGSRSRGWSQDVDRMTFVPQYWDGGQVSDTLDVSMAVKGQMMPEKRRMFAVVTPFVKAKRARSDTDDETWKASGVAPTLNQFDVGDTRATAVAVSGFYPHSSGRSGFGIYEDLSPTVTVGTGLGIPSPPGVFDDNLAVRRLTPRECERLMGWPDDWTRWDSDGKEVADSQRYKMCGNGVVSNVTEWFGRRLPA